MGQTHGRAAEPDGGDSGDGGGAGAEVGAETGAGEARGPASGSGSGGTRTGSGAAIVNGVIGAPAPRATENGADDSAT
ncbi:hypothetical protein ADK38_35690, partial [Streptomyces varsoviensis]